MNLTPVTLEGRHIRLEPLSLDHCDELFEAGGDESIWRWNPRYSIRNREDMRGYIDSALQMQAAGRSLPFATIEKGSNRAIGSTRYAEVDTAHRRLEIGYTWIMPAWQRTAVNTEAKYLMLCHAFETLGCVRVQLRTDVLNERSRRAIARLGATQEGIFRNDMIPATGRRRDSIYFSILDGEWPAVKRRLEERLSRGSRSPE